MGFQLNNPNAKRDEIADLEYWKCEANFWSQMFSCSDEIRQLIPDVSYWQREHRHYNKRMPRIYCCAPSNQTTPDHGRQDVITETGKLLKSIEEAEEKLREQERPKTRREVSKRWILALESWGKPHVEERIRRERKERKELKARDKQEKRGQGETSQTPEIKAFKKRSLSEADDDLQDEVVHKKPKIEDRTSQETKGFDVSTSQAMPTEEKLHRSSYR